MATDARYLTTPDDPDLDEATLRFLVDLPGMFLPHSGTTLFQHLLGTYHILRSWQSDSSLCLAGLLHSVYGTPAYKGAPLPRSRRGEVRRLIGTEAEELVYQFSRANWTSILESGDDVLKATPRSLLTLAAANVVEQAERLARIDPDDLSMSESLQSFGRLIPFLVPAAAHSLLAALQNVRDQGLRHA